jgi:hypothetical protein
MLKTLIGLTVLLPFAALASYSATVTLTPPTTYTDGSPITKQLTYSVYDADTDNFLYGTTSVSQVRTLDDSVKCVYFYAAEYDAVNNREVLGTRSDRSPVGCKPIVIKKVGTPTVAPVIK